MYNDLNKILKKAVLEEEYFNRFYLALAAKITDKAIKSEMIRIAAEEKLHSRNLQELSFDPKNFNMNPDVAEEISIAINVQQKSIESFSNAKDMIAFAIKQEILAQMMYNALMEAAVEDEAKGLFLLLSKEEKKHESMLTLRLGLLQ
jgi:rubrerythrin